MEQGCEASVEEPACAAAGALRAFAGAPRGCERRAGVPGTSADPRAPHHRQRLPVCTNGTL